MPGLMKSLEDNLLRHDEADRKKRPYAFVDAGAEILFIQNVARMLGCTVDQTRRIPSELLPARQGPGKRRLYLKEDVIRYVRGMGSKASFVETPRRATGQSKAELVDVEPSNVETIEAARLRLREEVS